MCSKDQFPGLAGWRRASCLGCGQAVVAARHAHVLIGGRRDGTALVIMGIEPDCMWAEEPDALSRQIFLLGVAHRTCVELARRQLHSGQVLLPSTLPALTVEEIKELPEQFHLPPNGQLCAFCGGGGKLSDEHVWPQWLSRALRQLPWAPKKDRPFVMRGPHDRRTRVIDVTAPICQACNNGWLAALEQDAQQALTPMITGRPVCLGRSEQALVAGWAVKTALIFDLSSRSEAIIPLGYYRQFGQTRAALDSMCVFVAGYAGRAPAWATREELWVSIPHDEQPNAFATTLTAGSLVLQVVGHFVKSASFRDLRWQFARTTRQIWPSIFETVSWPPVDSICKVTPLSIRKLTPQG